MEGLDLDNILLENEAETLFSSVDDNPFVNNEQEQESEQEKEQEVTEEIDADNLFADTSESVGNENDKEVEEDIESEEISSSQNFYSSITRALAEEDVFQDLEEDTINSIDSPEAFKQLIEDQINAGLEDRQKRVYEALTNNVEPSDIRKYENTIGYLNSITDDKLNSEDEEGENLRKQLIYQDYINRGYSAERAQKEVTKSFNSGSDLEDAKDALEANKQFYGNSYKMLLDDAKKEQERIQADRKKQADKLQKDILESKQLFGDLELDKKTRQQIFDNISKPIYRDKKTNRTYTAIQKYEEENRTDFLKNLAICYTLTDGFKNFDKLVQTKAKKEVKKGLKNLEKTINSTSRNSDGSLRFVSGVNKDPESYLGKGWDLDV